MPRESNICSEFDHKSRTDENGTRANNCRDKPTMVERLVKSTQAVSLRIVSIFVWFQFLFLFRLLNISMERIMFHNQGSVLYCYDN